RSREGAGARRNPTEQWREGHRRGTQRDQPEDGQVGEVVGWTLGEVGQTRRGEPVLLGQALDSGTAERANCSLGKRGKEVRKRRDDDDDDQDQRARTTI